jgi:hypothetical protein
MAIGAVGSVVFADGGGVAIIADAIDTSDREAECKRERETFPPMAPAYVHSIHKWGTSA